MCDCKIEWHSTTDPAIVYCPEHSAAPELRSALRDIEARLSLWVDHLGATMFPSGPFDTMQDRKIQKEQYQSLLNKARAALSRVEV